MNVKLTENPAEKALEQVSDNKPVSVYSVNFARAVRNLGGKRFIVKRPLQPVDLARRNSLSGRIFNLRNAVLTAAILAVGVLHFAFQMSFIQTEVGKNLPPVKQVPPVKSEPARVAAVENLPAEVEVKKADAVLPAKNVRTNKSRLAVETAPAKPQTKRREAGETRAERLRRAERILTGV